MITIPIRVRQCERRKPEMGIHLNARMLPLKRSHHLKATIYPPGCWEVAQQLSGLLQSQETIQGGQTNQIANHSSVIAWSFLLKLYILPMKILDPTTRGDWISICQRVAQAVVDNKTFFDLGLPEINAPHANLVETVYQAIKKVKFKFSFSMEPLETYLRDLRETLMKKVTSRASWCLWWSHATHPYRCDQVHGPRSV